MTFIKIMIFLLQRNKKLLQNVEIHLLPPKYDILMLHYPEMTAFRIDLIVLAAN